MKAKRKMKKLDKQSKERIRNQIEMLKFEFDDLTKGNAGFFHSFITPTLLVLISVILSVDNNVVKDICIGLSFFLIITYFITQSFANKKELELKMKILQLYAELET